MEIIGIEQRRKLPVLVKHFGLPLIAAECGVAGGSFSQELLEAGIETIYCIDNWSHIPNVTGDGNYEQSFHDMCYKEYENRFSDKLKDRVITLKGLSSEMHKYIPDNSLGLFYHDASHTYESVKEDIGNYLPKLISGGIMGFHDYYNEGSTYGVKQAVDEFALLNGYTINNIPEENPNVASVWFRVK